MVCANHMHWWAGRAVAKKVMFFESSFRSRESCGLLAQSCRRQEPQIQPTEILRFETSGLLVTSDSDNHDHRDDSILQNGTTTLSTPTAHGRYELGHKRPAGARDGIGGCGYELGDRKIHCKGGNRGLTLVDV